jgi:hypothetical protein
MTGMTGVIRARDVDRPGQRAHQRRDADPGAYCCSM